MSLNDIVVSLSSVDVKQLEEALLHLIRRTKLKEDVAGLLHLNAQQKLFHLLDIENGKYQVAVLSILANCANVDENWRNIFLSEERIQKLTNILTNQTDASIICRVSRLFANISKDHRCLSLIQENKVVIVSLLRHGATMENTKCQSACLRALRIICVSKESARTAAENEHFPTLLDRLHSTDPDLMLLCIRLICELLKTQAIEVGFRVIEESVLHKLLQLGTHTSEDIRDLILEILFLLTLTGGCRVAVAMEGAIELFLQRIRNHDNTESFKYATQGLCLCAREAVSRNKMKLCGVLQQMVRILQNDAFGMYHESLVAAFVWFLFDDSSLGILIRADVTPSLLHYLSRLTTFEYEQLQDLDSAASSSNETDFETSPPVPVERRQQSFFTNTHHSLGQDFQRSPPPQWVCSSPETSPYHANSPQYSIPSFSPHMSPSYSPPASPYNPSSPEYHDGYSDSLNETCGSSSKTVPYHFQSADGAHAMIHGARGPIHDTLLLLSRFSQAKDPSSFFLYLPGFNSMLNYTSLSKKPNPKCARILNRLTLNSHCFDLLLKKKLIPRLYLRLCTGWSLEHLSKSLASARHIKQDERTDIGKETSDNEDGILEDNLYQNTTVSRDCHGVGKLLLSNTQAQSETPYGRGVLSKILLMGSKELQEICVLSLPHIIWSVRLRQQLLVDCKGFNMLMNLLQLSLDKDAETFILIVEAVCSLCRLVQLYSMWPSVTTDCRRTACRTAQQTIHTEKKELNVPSDEPPRKKRRVEEISKLLVTDHICNTTEKNKISLVTILLTSGAKLACNRELLRKHSEVFDRMLQGSVYIESKQTVIEISDVNEEAFVTMVHYMHGCEVRLDKYTACDVCLYIHNDEKHSTVSSEDSTNERTLDDLMNRWRFAIDLLSCCERFFVDELKTCCELYLREEISANNAADIYMLASWYHSPDLCKHSLVFLLTKVECPKLRSCYFMEILRSHERGSFLSRTKCMIMEKLKKEK